MLYLELGCLRISTIIKCRRINFLHYLISTDKNKMLYKFFATQWKYPNKNDWTETVRQDLKDLSISENLNFIEKKSQQSFKTLVKSKAIEYEMKYLNKKKEPMSKMEDLDYNKFEMAKYLELADISVKEAHNIFQFRSKMAKFKDNYGGIKTSDNICHLCHSHTDTQKSSFECSVIKENINLEGKYSDIMKGSISKELAKTLSNILKIREMSPTEAQKCTGLPSAAHN